MKFFKITSLLVVLILLTGCIGNMNPTGGNTSPNYPYFITTEAMVVKNIPVPTGTKLVYEEQFLKKGSQNRILRESNLKTIEFPMDEPMYWGGVPVTSINKFFNSEMRGFSVYADFSKLSSDQQTKFSQLWESCSDDIGVMVKDLGDWSFNKTNITDVNSCSVNYQRYFKDDDQQQLFLDNMYAELNKIGSE